MGKESSSKELKEAPLKKRKKELPTSENPEKVQVFNTFANDEYKVVIAHEEEEAALRNAETDLTSFCKTTEKLRKIAMEIIALHSKKTPQATSQAVNKRIQGAILFVTLKKLNRLEKFRMNQSREKLHKARQQVDSCHLQLQNLLYEVLHLKKEVAKCHQFKSNDEDIDLLPLEEFYKEAPESISRPEVTKNDPHQLKLARMEWELMQRKAREALTDELKAKKEQTVTDIKKRKNLLSNLNPMLKEIVKAALPVQNMLGLAIGPPLVMQKPAVLLPHPLCFLFVEANALRTAGDKCLRVKVQGDEEDAVRLKQVVDEPVSPDDSDSDTQEEVVAKRHGHRKKSRTERLEERKKQLLMAHPLTLVIDIKMKGSPASISLEFTYFVKLHVVTVKPTVRLTPDVNLSSTSSSSKLVASENILDELFPEDFGNVSPNPANVYQLKQVGIKSFDTAQLGLPFTWAQQVTGLNFSGSSEVVANPKICQVYLPGVIKAIKKRISSRLSLCEQLQTLETKVIPNIPEVRKCFPQKLIVELTQWSSLTWTGYQALGFTQQVVDKEFVSESDHFYKGTLVRSNARLTMAVAIKNCYPSTPPLFTLQAAYGNNTTQAANNDSIRDIEREVNVYCDELLDKRSLQNILTAQILRLMTCFDILLEASTNQDFPREKTFVQPNRGRNRAWPFKGIARGDGVFHFTQR